MSIKLAGDMPFAELIGDVTKLGLVGKHMQDTIWKSFGVDALGTLSQVRPSERETKRRSAIYIKWFGIMRKDLKYSLEKTLDMLPVALRSELDGLPFNPAPAEQSWVVPNSGRPMVASLDEDFGDGAGEPEEPAKPH
jgi:hypothetical protein